MVLWSPKQSSKSKEERYFTFFLSDDWKKKKISDKLHLTVILIISFFQLRKDLKGFSILGLNLTSGQGKSRTMCERDKKKATSDNQRQIFIWKTRNQDFEHESPFTDKQAIQQFPLFIFLFKETASSISNQSSLSTQESPENQSWNL